jgi:hypothetical protein
MKKYKDAILSTVTGALFGLGIVAACVASIKPPVEVKAVNIVHETQKDARHEQEPVKSYTDEELELLALVIYQEAGSDACTDDTRLKVGTVVMNRVADHRFPDTLREVVLQRGQYGRLYWTGAEWPERANNEAEAHAVARAYDCAEQVLQGHRALPADTVYQAEFEQGDEVVAHQDGFYFCRWEV